MVLEDVDDALYAGVINSDDWDSNLLFLLWVFLNDQLS
jgi:hypothetical protein